MAGSMVQSGMRGLAYRDAPIQCELPGGAYSQELTIATTLLCVSAAGMGAILPLIFERKAAALESAPPDVVQHLGSSGKASRNGFFATTFLGTGAVISLALMYLLAPAMDLLRQPCLRAKLGDYDWAPTIVGLTVMVLLLSQLLAPIVTSKVTSTAIAEATPEVPFKVDFSGVSKFTSKIASKFTSKTHVDIAVRPDAVVLPAEPARTADPSADTPSGDPPARASSAHWSADANASDAPVEASTAAPRREAAADGPSPNASGDNSLGSTRANSLQDLESGKCPEEPAVSPDNFDRLFSFAVLLSGALIRTVFTGIALGANGATLTIAGALLFVEMLEGLALGSRLALLTFSGPRMRRWAPYGICAGYACVTPVATIIGLGVRSSDPTRRLLVSGVFSAVGAGLLLYVGLFEMLAKEFLLKPRVPDEPLARKLCAFGLIVLGFGMVAATAAARW